MALPLFLLAPPRSYTSLMNAMLGQHPQAFGLPELCLFNVQTLKELWVRESDEMENHTKTRQGLLRAVAEIYAGEQTTATITMAHHWCAARQDWTTADVYHELVAKIDPLIPVEKSPSYTISVKRMHAIRKAFPDARFLHLTRHPIGQCKSVMNMNEGAFALYVNSIEFQEDRAIVEPQFAWHDLNVNILDFLATVPAEQQMCVHGEDMMSNPRYWLVKVCRWLGIRDDDYAVEQMMHPELSPFACFGPITALFGNDPNFLRGPTFRPHRVKVPPLERPVPWRTDGKGLYPEVIDLARVLGYGDTPCSPPATHCAYLRGAPRSRLGPIGGDPVTTFPNLDDLTPHQRALRDALLSDFKLKKVKQLVRKQAGYIKLQDRESAAGGAIGFLFDEHGRPPANVPIGDVATERRTLEHSKRWVEAILVQLRIRHEALRRLENNGLDRLIEAVGEGDEVTTTGDIIAASELQDALVQTKGLVQQALQAIAVTTVKARKLKKVVEKSVTNIHTGVMVTDNIGFLFEQGLSCSTDTTVEQIIKERRRVGRIISWMEAMLTQIDEGLFRLKEIESLALDNAKRACPNQRSERDQAK